MGIVEQLGCLRSLLTPCDVDILCVNMTLQIKEDKSDVMVEMTDRNDNNRLQRCAEPH